MGKTWADITAKHQRTVVSETIALASDLADEHDRLGDQLVQARIDDERENRDAVAPQIARRMEDLAEALRASEVTFTFQAMGRSAYRRLMLEHPPTREQQETAGEFGVGRLEHNNDTYPPALLKACCIGVMDADGEVVDVGTIDWVDLWDTWSHGQTQRLWRACVAANTAVADAPKPVAGSAPTRGSRRS